MSSGWPPEEDDRRWEPVRHSSVVGAGHDSRDADRGYSGYARDPADADESGGSGPSDVPLGYDEDSWYAPADAAGPADAPHPTGPLPCTHGYGGIGGAGLYGAPIYAEADYQGAGPGDTQYEDGPYEDEQYDAAPHGAAEYGPAGYGQAHQPGAARYAGVLYDQQPYALPGPRREDRRHRCPAPPAPEQPAGWPPPRAQRRPQALVRAGRGRGRLRRGDRGHRHGRLPVWAGRPRAHPGDPGPAECLLPAGPRWNSR